jgi:hypothetical protein
VGKGIHIICLATPSEKLKQSLYCTGAPAENFWRFLTKNNLNDDHFVSATRGGLIIQDGRRTRAEASEKAKNHFHSTFG